MIVDLQLDSSLPTMHGLADAYGDVSPGLKYTSVHWDLRNWSWWQLLRVTVSQVLNILGQYIFNLAAV